MTDSDNENIPEHEPESVTLPPIQFNIANTTSVTKIRETTF